MASDRIVLYTQTHNSFAPYDSNEQLRKLENIGGQDHPDLLYTAQMHPVQHIVVAVIANNILWSAYEGIIVADDFYKNHHKGVEAVTRFGNKLSESEAHRYAIKAGYPDLTKLRYNP